MNKMRFPHFDKWDPNCGYAHTHSTTVCRLDQHPTDSESVEDFPSLPSHLVFQVFVSLGFDINPPVRQEHSIMPTESATLPYDFNRSVSLHAKETEKTGRLDMHTTASESISGSTPQSIVLDSF